MRVFSNAYKRGENPALNHVVRCTPARMIRISIIMLLVALLFLFQGGAMADRHLIEARRTQPVYNEATKSYFQYIEYEVDTKGVLWAVANQLAVRLVYKGVKGRLAVIRDPEVNNFLRRNFEPRYDAWIGLRYFCSFRKSMWVTGEVVERQDFQNWEPRWYRNDGITCDAQRGAFQYMPVYYRPAQSGFRWQAAGPDKKFYGYFVEYDTGKE